MLISDTIHLSQPLLLQKAALAERAELLCPHPSLLMPQHIQMRPQSPEKEASEGLLTKR